MMAACAANYKTKYLLLLSHCYVRSHVRIQQLRSKIILVDHFLLNTMAVD